MPITVTLSKEEIELLGLLAERDERSRSTTLGRLIRKEAREQGITLPSLDACVENQKYETEESC